MLASCSSASGTKEDLWATGDRDTQQPIPDHISAKPEDLPDLVDGLIAFDRKAARELDPVVAAAALAFGFVYIHPFEDGNGRLHRYLIHHVLAARGFNPPGVTFPVSAAIQDRIRDYRATLEDYSKRLLPAVDWRPTEQGNVTVRNDTALTSTVSSMPRRTPSSCTGAYSTPLNTTCRKKPGIWSDTMRSAVE